MEGIWMENLTRYFIRPKLKSKQTGSQHTCWQLCGERGGSNHKHIFWECHKLNLFWESVHNIMKNILEYVIPRECKVMYLGSLNNYVPRKRNLTKMLLVTCKKATTRNWCKAEPPTTTQWLEIMREVYIMERMTHRLRMTEGVFVFRWEKWMPYDTVNHD